MIIDGKDFPDECPDGCPGLSEYPDMGSLCFRCPIFNCKANDDGFRMLKPGDVHPAIAEAYFEMFAGIEEGQ